jgi:integrase
MSGRQRDRQWVQEGAIHLWRSPFIEDGKWRVRARRKADGRVLYRTLKAEVLKSKGRGLGPAMEEVAALAAGEVDGDAPPPPPPSGRERPPTVKIVLQRWLAEQKPHVAAATFIDYSNDVERIINVLGPEVLITDITKDTLKKKFEERWGTLGARTRQKMAMYLRWIFSDLVVDDVIPSSPAVVLKTRRRAGQAIKAARVERHQIITVNEARAIVKAAMEPVILKYRGGSTSDPLPPEPWILIWLLLSMKAGLRIGDTLGSQKYSKPGLRWRSIDLERGWIEIPWSEYKGGRSLRVVMADELWRALRTYRDSLPEAPSPEDRVVPGNVMDPRKTLRRLVRIAGLTDTKGNFTGELADKLSPHPLTDHSLRKSFGAWLDQYVGNPSLKRILLGHAAAEVSDLYGGKLPEKDLRKALAKIPSLMPSKGAIDKKEAAG